MPPRTNVRPREVEKFRRLAARWWDPLGPMHSLHAVNPLRMGFIAREIEVRHLRVVDVGCGAGLLTESLARLGARVTGIDLAPDLVDMARMHATQKGLLVDYRILSIEELAQDLPGIFDVVTCMEVLEHIPQPAKVVGSCARLLKPRGHAFFSTIDRSLKSFVFAILGAEYILRLLPVGSHRYASLIRPADLRSWAQSHALQLVRSAGISYNLLTRKFSLTSQPDVNYMMHFIKT